MKNIIPFLGALAVIVGIISLSGLLALPPIKTNTHQSEETIFQQTDPYFQALRQAEEDSY